MNATTQVETGPVRRIPMWVKVSYTAFMCVLVPFYWHAYGPTNFLYFCDLALLLTLVALWLENPLLASIAAVEILLPGTVWVADFIAELCGGRITGMASYMFKDSTLLFARALSGYHGWLPVLLVWVVSRLGYDRRALGVWTVLAWALMLVSYFCLPAPPAPAATPNLPVNVNYVYGPNPQQSQTWMAPGLYFVLVLIGFPLMLFLPAHWILLKLFGQGAGVKSRAKADAPLVERHPEMERSRVLPVKRCTSPVIRIDARSSLKTGPNDYFGKGPIISLRLILVGAEQCPEALFTRCAELAPHAALLEGYGITECSPVVSANVPGATRPGTVGKPLPGVELLVLDLDTEKSVGPNQLGMLLVGGPTIFPGYIGCDGPSPFKEIDGKRWYVTGDLAKIDEDGFVHFCGRLKRFLKAGGEMISLPALEEPFARQYPPTKDGPRVAVEGVETDGGRRIVLFSTQALNVHDANAKLIEEGLRGVMRLDEVRQVEKIPVLGTGKTDYKALLALIEK